MPAVRREAVLALLCEPNPLNLEAQAMLYQSEIAADAATRTALEKQFITASMEAMKIFLGWCAAQERPATASGLAILCGHEALGAAADQISNAGRAIAGPFERRAQSAVALAATIPSDVVVAQLHPTLSRHWSEGPLDLRAAGVPGDILVEPGFITTLKSLRARAAGRRRPRRRDSRRLEGTITTRRLRLRDRSKRMAPSRGTIRNLLAADVIQRYCRSLHTVALARAAYHSGDASYDGLRGRFGPGAASACRGQRRLSPGMAGEVRGPPGPFGRGTPCRSIIRGSKNVPKPTSC